MTRDEAQALAAVAADVAQRCEALRDDVDAHAAEYACADAHRTALDLAHLVELVQRLAAAVAAAGQADVEQLAEAAEERAQQLLRERFGGRPSGHGGPVGGWHS